MARASLPVFDGLSTALDARIAQALHKLSLVQKHASWKSAAEAGLSPTQGQILTALVQEGALTGSELGARLGVSLPTVSDSVRVLAEKGLVSKKPDPRHPRASLVELTAAGRKQAQNARTWPDYLASAVGTLTAEEQEVFNRGLLKMIHALQESGDIPTQQMCVSCTHFRPNAHRGPLPHHCALVDAPMADRHLRLECREHEEATPEARASLWNRFAGP